MSFVMHFCTICGREKTKPDWFLIAVNRWGDKLNILEWNERDAGLNGVQEVCGAAHARELILHWIRTGTLAFPATRTRSVRGCLAPRAGEVVRDIPDARPLGELYLHRESINRILDENPQSLTAIIDELLSGLNPQHEVHRFSETPRLSLRQSQLVGD